MTQPNPYTPTPANPQDIYSNSLNDLERMLAAIALQLARLTTAVEKLTTRPPECAHGTRVHVTGDKDGKPWAMWACPLPQDRRDERCAPIWIDT